MSNKEQKTLRDAMKESKEGLVEALKNNPDHIDIDGTTYNGNSIIRVYFDKRNDDANPMTLVLEQPSFLDTATPEDIAELIKTRSLIDNQSITPNIGMMIEDVKSGKSVLNNDIIGAALEMENTIKTYRKKVKNNPHADWFLMDNCMVENIIKSLDDRAIDPLELRQIGYDLSDKFTQMRDQIINGAKEVLFSNTMEDGTLPLHKTKHIIDNMLSESGSAKIMRDDKSNAYLYDDLKDAINDVLEINGYAERDYDFASLIKFKRENPKQEQEVEPAQSLDDFLSDMGIDKSEMDKAVLESEQKKKTDNKKRNKIS